MVLALLALAHLNSFWYQVVVLQLGVIRTQCEAAASWHTHTRKLYLRPSTNNTGGSCIWFCLPQRGIIFCLKKLPWDSGDYNMFMFTYIVQDSKIMTCVINFEVPTLQVGTVQWKQGLSVLSFVYRWSMCCDFLLVLDFPKELSDMFDPTKGKHHATCSFLCTC